MMVTTRYTHALGDYVLEFIGLKAWTGEYSGTHLTIFYFGTLTILGLYLVRKYVIEEWGMRTRNVIILFIVLITVFTSVTNFTARSVKKYSDGLLSVGYNSENSRMSYRSKEMEYTEFNAEIEMMNYGDESKEFNLVIVSPFYREEGTEHIDIFTKDKNKAIFRLDGNETKTFKINLNEYKISGGRLSLNGGGSGLIQDIILTDAQGKAIRLGENNFFGIQINR